MKRLRKWYLPVTLITVVALFALAQIQRNSSVTAKISMMNQQITSLTPRSGDVLIDSVESHKPEALSILRVYSTSSDFDSVKKDYDAQLGKSGFRLVSASTSNAPKQQTLIYCKESLDAELTFLESAEKLPAKYTISLKHYDSFRLSINRGFQLGSGC